MNRAAVGKIFFEVLGRKSGCWPDKGTRAYTACWPVTHQAGGLMADSAGAKVFTIRARRRWEAHRASAIPLLLLRTARC
jgi:hypothetical protein